MACQEKSGENSNLKPSGALLSVTKKYPDLMLGIGTIMDGPTTKKFIDAGADFIISPIIKLEYG